LSFVFVISDKKAACFALGGALKAREFWTLLKCEIECCTGIYCNTQTPTLSENATTVFGNAGYMFNKYTRSFNMKVGAGVEQQSLKRFSIELRKERNKCQNLAFMLKQYR